MKKTYVGQMDEILAEKRKNGMTGFNIFVNPFEEATVEEIAQ